MKNSFSEIAPIRLEAHSYSIGRFRLTRSDGFQEGTFHHCDFLPYNQSILFRKKGFIQKSATSCQNISFFGKVLLPNFMVQFNLPFFLDFPTPLICMAEGVSVLSYPFFLDINRKRGFCKNGFCNHGRIFEKTISQKPLLQLISKKNG